MYVWTDKENLKMLFGKKKKPANSKSEDKAKDSTDLKIKLDSVEMESVAEQLKEIEAQKAKKEKS